jgi:uncharacterized membrane protein YfhO
MDKPVIHSVIPCRRHPLLTLLSLTTLIVALSLLPLWLISGYDQSFDDFICQQIPFLLETKRMLASGHPWWSWNTFFGENFLASYSFYTVTSPFAWIVALFPQSAILSGIIFAFWLKCLAVACVAYLYFKRMKFSVGYCIAGGLLYCFSSFFITNLRYYHFCEPMMMFPLLLIAIENVLEHRKYGYSQLALASFGVTWINFYFALPSFLFAALYMLFRIYWGEYNSGKRYGKVLCVVKSCGAVLVGVLLSSVVLFPTIAHLIGAPRATVAGFSSAKSILDYILYCLDIIRTFLMPALAELTPYAFLRSDCWSRSLFLPVIGLLVVILFLYKEKQHRWLKFFICTLFLVAFTPLNGIFSGFTSPEYRRWFYAFSLMLILCSMDYLCKYKISRRVFVGYALFTLLFVFGLCGVSVYFHKRLNEREILEVSLTCLNLLLLGLFVFSRQKVGRLICLVSVSAVMSLGCSVWLNLLSGDVHHPQGGRIYKYVVENPLTYNTELFTYRIDANNAIRNIYLLKNRPGVTSFHSVFDKNQIDYRAVIDSSCTEVTMEIHKGRVAHDILLSVKEFYDYRENEIEENAVHLPQDALRLRDSLARYSKYDFLYYVPMGFCYDTYIKRSEYDAFYSGLADPVKPMLVHLVVEDEDVDAFRTVMKHGGVVNTDTIGFEPIVSKLRKHTATSFAGNTHGFVATAELDSARVMFFSVSPDPGFRATIDGEPTRIYRANLGFSAIMVPAGKHEIQFEFLPIGLKSGCVGSLAAGFVLLLLCYQESRSDTKDEKPTQLA